MAFTISELQELRKKLDRDRRELEERERALAKVEEMLREEMTRMQGTTLPAPEVLPKPEGLSDAVSIAIESLAGREFTVPDVEDYLTQVGFQLPKEPRSRIAMVLQKMHERGQIIRTFEGKGRAPHRYSIKRALHG
jgi:hypothetical protein